MRTQLERLISDLGASRSEARRLQRLDHEPRDCAALLKDVGGTLETFLKARIHAKQGTFYQLTEDLAALGVAPGDIAGLHALRSLYNSAKHDPAFQRRSSSAH